MSSQFVKYALLELLKHLKEKKNAYFQNYPLTFVIKKHKFTLKHPKKRCSLCNIFFTRTKHKQKSCSISQKTLQIDKSDQNELKQRQKRAFSVHFVLEQRKY